MDALGAAFLTLTFAFDALDPEDFATGFLTVVSREAFWVILLSHSSISASSEARLIVTSGLTPEVGSTTVVGDAVLAYSGFATFLLFLLVADERSAFAVPDQLMRLKFLMKC